MNIIWAVILLIGGLAILWKAADLLVAGAVAMAGRLGVTPLVIGMTIVAMGTSAPEVAASIAGVLRGPGGGDIALGNVLGSNIANLALIGGLSALIRPIKVRKLTLAREMPVMFAVALLLWPVLYNLNLSRPEGAALLVLFAGLMALTIYGAGHESTDSPDSHTEFGENIPKEAKTASRSLAVTVLFVAIGLVGLAAGAKMTVEGAVFIGLKIGLSKGVIALTVIAFGTSLPELVTCLVAALKGHHDISIGNLVGSNVFNTLLVTGAAGVVRPFDVAERLVGPDYWIMIAVSAAFILAVVAGRRTIGRLAGSLLLAGYITYMTYLLACTR
ncbi:MAG: calcium/sodium antiporter [Planctomycetota bacterium]|jgi:cation:H+ antiporter